MKYFISLCFLILSVSSGSSQLKLKGNEFLLTGKVIGLDTGFVYLRYVDTYGKFRLDSCSLNNGSFRFGGKINEPGIASFYGKRKSRSVDDPNFTDIFLEPAIIHGTFLVDNFKQGKITGSKSHKELTIYNSRYDSLQQKWKPTWDKLSAAKEQKATAVVEGIYNDELPLYRLESDNLVYRFIRDFPKSYVSAYFLRYQTHRLSTDSLKQFFKVLDPLVQRSRDGKEIAAFISRSEKLLIGSILPNFTQKDINGNTISLYEYRGKHVLLDFWASWCIPCREQHPYLKSAYAKYRDKGFEIISFSLDQEKDKDAWMAAIKTDGLTWAQVCDFMGWGSDVVQRYNLYGKGIPANFLIDREGRILAKDLRGRQFEEHLLKHLNDKRQ